MHARAQKPHTCLVTNNSTRPRDTGIKTRVPIVSYSRNQIRTQIYIWFIWQFKTELTPDKHESACE